MIDLVAQQLKKLTWLKKKFVKFYVDNLKCKIDGQVDDEFGMLVQILYFFGFIGGFNQPKHTRRRAIYGVSTYIVVVLTFLLGIARTLIEALTQDNLGLSMVMGVTLVFIVPNAIQIFKTLREPSSVTSLIAELNNVHKRQDMKITNEEMEATSRNCAKIAKAYRIVLFIIVTLNIIIKASGHGIFVLTFSAIYDVLARGYFFYFWMVVNAVHGYAYASLILLFDLLPVFAMIRLAMNLKLLSNEVRKSADSFDFKANEKNLVACVKYHCDIIAKFEMFRGHFSKFFVTKIYGMLMVLTCVFYLLLKGDYDTAILRFYASAFFVVVMFQLATLCYFGQKVQTSFEDLLDATYGCDWISQPNSFMKSLIIIRFVCLRNMTIGVGEFYFTHETYWKIMYIVYNNYHNLCSMLNSFRLKGKGKLSSQKKPFEAE